MVTVLAVVAVSFGMLFAARILTGALHALAPRVLAVLGLAVLIMGGQFAALTFVTPFLEQVTGIPGPIVSVFLFAYGIASAVGTFAGGWAADRNATRSRLQR